jgi:hypothetical protein
VSSLQEASLDILQPQRGETLEDQRLSSRCGTVFA